MSATVPAIGDALPTRTFGPLTRTDFVRYAGASGDFNPIHHDEAYARQAGFPTVFSVGMLQAGILAGCAAEWLGPKNVRRLAVRFREQVWPGDELTCTGTVTNVEDIGGAHRVELDLTCTRQTGDVAIAGTATFELPG